MPDAHPPYTWQQVARDILAVVQIIALAYVARLGNVNHEQVERKTTEIVEKQDSAEKKVEKVKATLETKTRRDDKAIEVNLRASWRYLQDLADESGSPRDQERATEAKKVLDDFLAHKNGS